jgi:hypothetical protein
MEQVVATVVDQVDTRSCRYKPAMARYLFKYQLYHPIAMIYIYVYGAQYYAVCLYLSNRERDMFERRRYNTEKQNHQCGVFPSMRRRKNDLYCCTDLSLQD